MCGFTYKFTGCATVAKWYPARVRSDQKALLRIDLERTLGTTELDNQISIANKRIAHGYHVLRQEKFRGLS